jgi:hypothetical protein
MISSQGTQVQRWGRGRALSLLLLVLAAHVAFACVAVLFCPELFHAERFQGGHCQSVADEAEAGGLPDSSCEGGCPVTGGEDVNSGGSRCVSRGDGETVRLSDLLLSFRFPREPRLSVWAWRATASLSLHIKILENHLVFFQDKDDANLNNSLPVNKGEIFQSVQLSASLDYALYEYLELAGDRSRLADTEDLRTPSAWHSRAIVRRVNRTLVCRHVDVPQSERAAALTEFNFVCVLHPLFELSPLSNASYIVSVHVEALEMPTEQEEKEDINNSSVHNIHSSGIDLIHSNATIASYVTVITETAAFHELRFYIKCLFTPLILVAFVWFMVRLCVHDLYVSIPDRLLMTASLAQLLVNLPTELIIAHVPIAHLILIDPIAEAILFTALALFWIVFTLDKLADNEPWERTTRYYWRSIGLMLAFAVLALLGVGYLEVPPFSNPFQNHWQPGQPTWVALGLIFGLAVGVAIYQSYLSVIVFRVICDISIQ